MVTDDRPTHIVRRVWSASSVLGLLLCVPACGREPPGSQSENGTTTRAATVVEIAHHRTQGADWPAFLGPQGDGTSAETGLNPDLWQPHPPLVWSLPLGVSYGGPTIAAGRLYQFDRFGVHERLSCFDAETAREIWRWESRVEYDDMYGYNNGPRCSPIVDGDRVYTYGVTGKLSCVAAETGELVWTKDITTEYSVVQNFFGVASAPYVFEDKLLVMVGGSPPESHALRPVRLDRVEPNGTAIVAFDKRTGDELYRLGDELASYASLTVREIEGRPTGLAFLRGGLIAWEPRSGQQLFQFPWRAPMLESVNAALPVTQANQILLSEAYEVGSVLLEVEQRQPRVVWKDQGQRDDLNFRAHWSTPILIDGYLYGCNGRNETDSDLRCIRWSDGEVQWRHGRREGRRERCSVLWVDGFLIALTEHGQLELIRPSPEKFDLIKQVDLNDLADPRDGQPLLESPCWAAPVLAHGLLYVRGNNRLLCFDLIPSENSR